MSTGGNFKQLLCMFEPDHKPQEVSVKLDQDDGDATFDKSQFMSMFQLQQQQDLLEPDSNDEYNQTQSFNHQMFKTTASEAFNELLKPSQDDESSLLYSEDLSTVEVPGLKIEETKSKPNEPQTQQETPKETQITPSKQQAVIPK